VIKLNEQNESNISSVEFSSTSKGIISFKLKVYDSDPDIAFQKSCQLTEQAVKYCEMKNQPK